MAKIVLLLVTLLTVIYISDSSASEQVIKDHYIVILKKGSPEDIARGAGVKVNRTYVKIFNGFSAQLPPKAVDALSKNPNVQEIIQDKIVSLELPAPTFEQISATWGIDRVDQRTLPLNSKYNYSFTGAGVSAYIVDSGINMLHNEFEGRAVPGFDAFTDGRNGSDCNGHGTHVAGTVGSKTYGIAKGVKLVSVRVLDCSGSGSWSGVLAGLDWIGVNNIGPAVANMSIGGGKSTIINQAVSKLSSLNVNVVVAAGNSKQDACNYSPSSAPEAITVGASDGSDIKASFSNYGNCIDLFAPGVSITSSWFSSNTAVAILSGTSMASPHVTGVAALFLEQNPNFSSSELASAIKATSTKSIVTNSRTVNNHLLYSFNDPSSSELSASTPIAPSNLSGSYSSKNGVSLKWSDLSNNEQGFEIHKSSSTETVVLTVGANAVSFKDLNIVAGETYAYKVRAFNSIGSSDFSNSVIVTVSSGGTKPRRK